MYTYVCLTYNQIQYSPTFSTDSMLATFNLKQNCIPIYI